MPTTKTRCARIYKYYVLLIMMTSLLSNQMCQFALIATIRSMSAELKFGDRICQLEAEISKVAAGTKNTSVADPAYALVNNTVPPQPFQCSQDGDMCFFDGSLNSNTTKSPSSGKCNWRYMGTGVAFQVLAGPLFVVIFGCSHFPVGILAHSGKINPRLMSSACIMLWSVFAILTGVSRAYWQVAVTRLLMGASAGAGMAVNLGIVAAYFPPKQMGKALSFFNVGTYLGFSTAFLFVALERVTDWRNIYYLCGSFGAALSLLVLATIKNKEPHDPGNDNQSKTPTSKTEHTQEDTLLNDIPAHNHNVNSEDKSSKALDQRDRADEKEIPLVKTEPKTEQHSLRNMFRESGKLFWTMIRNPVLVALFVGGAIRMGAGLIFGYNINNFYFIYHPQILVEKWLSWIIPVFGASGAMAGGVLSDITFKRCGPVGRIVVLLLGFVLTMPLMAAVFFTPPPGSQIFLIPVFFISESWIGVCVASVVDQTHPSKAPAYIAIYQFVIMIIGGPMTVLVAPLSHGLHGLKYSLLFLMILCLTLSVVIFLIPFYILYKKRRTQQ